MQLNLMGTDNSRKELCLVLKWGMLSLFIVWYALLTRGSIFERLTFKYY